MVPIVLDASRVPLLHAGRGETLVRRLDRLLAGRAERLSVFADEPNPALTARLGPALVERLPTATGLAQVRLVWLAGLPATVGDRLAETARRVGVLTNVEDVLEARDFHRPAVVRRGDLLPTVPTGGESPGLASRIRPRLEAEHGSAWGERLDHLARERTARCRKTRGRDGPATLTGAAIDAKGRLARETRR